MSLAPVIQAADVAEAATSALSEAEAELDQAIAEARAGGATIPDLMQAAGRSRQGIYNALRRAR